jgi:hypothetical protein
MSVPPRGLLALEFPLQLNFLFERSLQSLFVSVSFLGLSQERKRNAGHAYEIKTQTEEGPPTGSIKIAFGA